MLRYTRLANELNSRDFGRGLQIAAGARAMTERERLDILALLAAPIAEHYHCGRSWLRRVAEERQSSECAITLKVVDAQGALRAASVIRSKGDRGVKIASFYVPPESRQAGIGTLLATQIVESAFEVGYEAVSMTSPTSMAHLFARTLTPAGLDLDGVDESGRYGQRSETCFRAAA